MLVKKTLLKDAVGFEQICMARHKLFMFTVYY